MLVKRVLNFFDRMNGRRNGKYSYSQCGEDLIVRHIFDSLKKDKITYLDVGAHHPFHLSNTAFFYQSGSRGINIEPNPFLFNEFKQWRGNDINLNIGVGTESAHLDFYVMDSPLLSTFSEIEAKNLVHTYNRKIERKFPVSVLPISSIIEEYSSSSFPDFLSLDVEGLDEAIIKSLPLNNYKPAVICVETISYSQSRAGVKNNEILEYLKANNFLVYADTNINTIFVDREVWERGFIA
jgi:FkbM family methyltransferase